MNSKLPKDVLKNKKAFLFDLGGVIYHIDLLRTIKKFREIFREDILMKGENIIEEPVFSDFERGKISENRFFDVIHTYCKPEVELKSVISAWNAMLINMPIRNLIAINRLRQTHKVFMLSNTNKTHIDYIIRQLKNTGMYNLFCKCFDHIYYSFEIGCAKPDKESFNIVLKDNDLEVVDVIFVDDKDENTRAAENMGIYSFLFKTNGDLTAIL